MIAEKPEFIPSHFAICKTGQPMPCRIVEESGEWATVESPGGKNYTYRIDSLLPADAARDLLARDRVDFVLANYSFRVAAFGTERSTGRGFVVVKCNHPSQGRRTYHLLIGETEIRCNCPSARSQGGTGCKHCSAAEKLIDSGVLSLANPAPAPIHIPSPAELQAEAEHAAAYADGWFDPRTGRQMEGGTW